MTEELLKRMEVNPAVMLGKPVIRGTRIPVELILRKLSEGATEEDLQKAYPHLDKKDFQAALLMQQIPSRMNRSFYRSNHK